MQLISEELVENSSSLVTVIVDILTEIKSLETDVQPRQEIKPEGWIKMFNQLDDQTTLFRSSITCLRPPFSCTNRTFKLSVSRDEDDINGVVTSPVTTSSLYSSSLSFWLSSSWNRTLKHSLSKDEDDINISIGFWPGVVHHQSSSLPTSSVSSLSSLYRHVFGSAWAQIKMDQCNGVVNGSLF